MCKRISPHFPDVKDVTVKLSVWFKVKIDLRWSRVCVAHCFYMFSVGFRAPVLSLVWTSALFLDMSYPSGSTRTLLKTRSGESFTGLSQRDKKKKQPTDGDSEPTHRSECCHLRCVMLICRVIGSTGNKVNSSSASKYDTANTQTTLWFIVL